ncbi:MAG TPA: ATP-binding protein [Solirubrobacterales bacterium]
MDALRLSPEQLRRRCDPDRLGFETTAEVEPLAETLGQPRALNALDFGLEMEAPGYHVFATGAIGTGRRSTLEALLRRRAAEREEPGDWVYLFDFAAPEKPRAVALPAGRGEELAREMSHLVEEARRRIAAAFESRNYQERRGQLGEELDRRSEEALGELRQFAQERSLALELTPAGVATIPLAAGRPLDPSEFQRLPEEERRALMLHTEEVRARLPAAMSRIAEIQREGRRELADLDREVAQFAIGHLVDLLKTRFTDVPDLVAWLERIPDDVVENLDRFRVAEAEQSLPEPMAASAQRSAEEFFGRYQPNVLVGHPDGDGAPVVVETNPSYYNLFGRLEYEASFGALITDHRRIKPGAIHRANGGYLLLDAAQVLLAPLVWEKLKETLRAREVRIESIGTQLTLFPTVTLEPQPIPLDLKVVLVGSPRVYALLYELDEDLRKLFRVRAEFDVEMPWGEEQPAQYAAFVARKVREEGLRPFDKGAVARVVEQGARLSEHQSRLSVRFLAIGELVGEASHWAGRAGRELVGAADVEKAIAQRDYRSNLVEEKVQQLIDEGTLMIDVTGERVGQVNGLSVALLGDYAFGRPSRITATVAVGGGEVLNIDRETELSGPIHDKGFLILAGYLRERYGSERPLSLAASLVFEQSYELIEGDSASGAELFALLSSLAEAPVRQGIAVTGSVNQHGRIQAIGGVNEKVEGFFEVCRRAGLDGEQGVIVPAANVANLMLREEVVEAVREGRFHVWAIDDVAEGLEILTGVPAGERRADGSFPEGTIHRRVEERLAAFAETGREFRAPAGGESEER